MRRTEPHDKETHMKRKPQRRAASKPARKAKTASRKTTQKRTATRAKTKSRATSARTKSPARTSKARTKRPVAQTSKISSSRSNGPVGVREPKPTEVIERIEIDEEESPITIGGYDESEEFDDSFNEDDEETPDEDEDF
jgi:hypothetical protein